MKPWPILFFALVACGDQPAGNAMTNAAVPDGPMPAGAPPLPKAAPTPRCEQPRLEFKYSGLGETEQSRLTNNFKVALDKACTEGLLSDHKLVDPRVYVKDTIFVVNAPNANVTSIYYAPSGAPPSMMMESPMGDPPQIPSVEELHEAIYCATKGATPEEQEESGRCLPD